MPRVHVRGTHAFATCSPGCSKHQAAVCSDSRGSKHSPHSARLPEGDVNTRQVLDIVRSYAPALDLLDDYDHQSVSRPEGKRDAYVITYDECGQKCLADEVLVAVTIMIAESRPQEKEVMVSLVMQFLCG